MQNNWLQSQLPASIRDGVMNLAGAWHEMQYAAARGTQEPRHAQRVKDAKQHLINILQRDTL